MDSGTLERLLMKDPLTRNNFRGVFSRDTLPRKRAVGLYIVNEDPSHSPGSHWIACHITPKKKKNIYFDSYGSKPLLNELRRFIGSKYICNKKQLQHVLSTSCGQWCMYFTWRRSQGWGVKNISGPFDAKKPLINDYTVNFLVEKRFNTDQDVLDRKFLSGQMNKSMKDVMKSN